MGCNSRLKRPIMNTTKVAKPSDLKYMVGGFSPSGLEWKRCSLSGNRMTPRDMGDTSYIVTTAAASTVLCDTSLRKDKQDVRTEWIAEKCEWWNYWTRIVRIHTIRKKESHREKRWQRHHENAPGKVLWVPDDILSGGVVDSLTEYWHSMSSKVSCNGKRIKYDEMRWCRWNVGKASMHSVSKPLY